MDANAPGALLDLYGPIREELKDVEAEIGCMMATREEALERLIRHVSRYAGKRLRPALTLLAGRLCGGIRPEHCTVGAIIELIHTATLVHDDVLDEAAVRRRVETISHWVGNETAVLLGDFIFATCFKEAASLEDRFVSRYLSEVVGIVCRGEILQVHHREDFDLTEQTYFRIIEDKTAALYSAALLCGARLSGSSEEVGRALAGFGTKMGCAFQIIDDILDLTGEESKVGKSLGTDLEKSKMTLPLLRLRDRCNERDVHRLRDAVFAGRGAERSELRPLLERYQAIASAQATAHEMVAEAKAALRVLPDLPERELLSRAADYILARDR